MIKKNKIKNRLSLLLILSGIIICIIPVAGKLYINYENRIMYEKYLAQIEEGNDILNETFKNDLDDNQIPSAENKPKKEIKDVIGRVSMDKISSNQLLLEGTDSYHLRYGAGHVIGTALPGESGNCCIAGHRNYTFGTYFNRIDELEKNDVIEVEYNGNKYSYLVYESFVVTPDDVSVLKGTDDKSELTLITCHPKGSNTKRLIIKCFLK